MVQKKCRERKEGGEIIERIQGSHHLLGQHVHLHPVQLEVGVKGLDQLAAVAHLLLLLQQLEVATDPLLLHQQATGLLLIKLTGTLKQDQAPKSVGTRQELQLTKKCYHQTKPSFKKCNHQTNGWSHLLKDAPFAWPLQLLLIHRNVSQAKQPYVQTALTKWIVVLSRAWLYHWSAACSTVWSAGTALPVDFPPTVLLLFFLESDQSSSSLLVSLLTSSPAFFSSWVNDC